MNLFKGWIGEMKTAFHLWLWLPSTRYRRFHNIILPSKSGTTQIDHLIVSVYGLFIVETKNKKGWIYGSENQAKWIQVLYSKKYSFQNPLRQTYRQKKVLSQFLNLDEASIQTVIRFVGDCKLKTKLPKNVRKSGVSRYIKRFRKQILSEEQVYRIIETIEVHLSESTLTSRDHRKSLRKRHSSKTHCPRCGSSLVKRTAKKGANAGSQFWGCENYPACRFSRDL